MNSTTVGLLMSLSAIINIVSWALAAVETLYFLRQYVKTLQFRCLTKAVSHGVLGFLDFWMVGIVKVYLFSDSSSTISGMAVSITSATVSIIGMLIRNGKIDVWGFISNRVDD